MSPTDSHPLRRAAHRLLPLLTLTLLLGPAAAMSRNADALSAEDIAWLRRDGFDLDSASVARYRELGRSRYLDEQLDNKGDDRMPPEIAELISGYEVVRTPPDQLLASLQQEQQRIKDMPEGDDKVAARKAQQQHANDLLLQAQQTELLRAVYGSNQLKEQMVWFWLNHFSVYGAKGRVRWVIGEYSEGSIRPHALGKFKDLVMATLESPAMLEFLDNAQNAKGHVNENYARELMELHTLGVGSGYTQQDVQQLALILTGVGIAPKQDRPQKLNPKFASLYVRNGLFEFNPARHDFGDKVLLGQHIKGSGFDEVEKAVDLITRQPACAQFISTKLARYFVADDPPPALVAKMAKTFQRTDGDIAKVLRTMLESKELTASQGKKFKDPTQFVVSSVRLAYDGKPVVNARPMLNWLNQLGEPIYGRLTPDGWPLDASGWASSGQMAKRFEIARAIGTGNNRLFVPEGSNATAPGFPMLTSRLYYDAIDPHLSTATRDALGKAASQQEWNTFLLSSPDFNYR
ncbi:Uncharacterized conserved protein, DUF1800 family [Dyella sp. OK004]|uniref:DUF1800 domain-containing protein n=1 Tax=Dyella sp. OK004 TaxID=1855292 RepID=UPI0008EF5F9C|nr:DUF1800 domain-containing protein [Dyella sp. OK004]SFS18457.1 Uncharacterized conserved protein, DUF1800 family [Dyella sp. OK004]